MTALSAAVCSIAPSRRRRFLWAAWWTEAPAREPFRKPDAHGGGARSREEAHRAAERAAGRRLAEIEPAWAQAWARLLQGEPPWPESRAGSERAASAGHRPAARAEPASPSAPSVLGIARGASIDEIKRAYRKRALETHPDRGGDAEAFRAVQRAFEQLVARRSRGRSRA